MAAPSHQPSESQPDSPLPPPPESSTSGPRAIALQTAFSKALEATLKKCNYDNFSACFPTAAQHAPDIMQIFWKTFTEKLEEICKVGTFHHIPDSTTLFSPGDNKKANSNHQRPNSPISSPNAM
jgi:hypothetical protein